MPLREEKIQKLYKENDINFISDLSIENLALLFNIQVEYYDLRSRCIYDEDMALIYLDQNQPYEHIRYDFFHEMAHFFEHCNDQRQANKEFVRLQERQASSFALYASMPRYLFEPYMNSVHSLQELIDAFQLPEVHIRERIRIIRQQNTTRDHYKKLKQREEILINRTLQKGKVYESTITVLDQLKKQVGEERMSYDVTRLL
ncbi:ImmA/IrrE family metallo-endopeptidase [Bacillus suaedae]|nr:ImmA/IrrE family metallo-endopeptidase [Bacillus suaedae]